MLEVCNCTKCGKYFNLAGAKEITKTYYTVKIKEKICPYCNSEQWEPIRQQNFLNKYLQFADNGYDNPLYREDDIIKLRR